MEGLNGTENCSCNWRNRGIGYELVKQLAYDGYKVILASRDQVKVAKMIN